MRIRHIAIFSAAVLAGALAGSLVGPRPAEAVARELIELQRDVTSLLQGQKDLSTQVTQDNSVMKTLIGQSSDTVGRLGATMSSLQKSVQDVQANSGARLDTMSTQVQGLRTISSITPRPTSPPTPSSISVKSPIPRKTSNWPSPNTKKFSTIIRRAPSSHPPASRRVWPSSTSARKPAASANSAKSSSAIPAPTKTAAPAPISKN